MLASLIDYARARFAVGLRIAVAVWSRSRRRARGRWREALSLLRLTLDQRCARNESGQQQRAGSVVVVDDGRRRSIVSQRIKTVGRCGNGSGFGRAARAGPRLASVAPLKALNSRFTGRFKEHRPNGQPTIPVLSSTMASKVGRPGEHLCAMMRDFRSLNTIFLPIGKEGR